VPVLLVVSARTRHVKNEFRLTKYFSLLFCRPSTDVTNELTSLLRRTKLFAFGSYYLVYWLASTHISDASVLTDTGGRVGAWCRTKYRYWRACWCMVQNKVQILEFVLVHGAEQSTDTGGRVGAWCRTKYRYSRVYWCMVQNKLQILEGVLVHGTEQSTDTRGRVGAWYKTKYRYSRVCWCMVQNKVLILEGVLVHDAELSTDTRGRVGTWCKTKFCAIIVLSPKTFLADPSSWRPED
jgi:hypothetical protein